MAKLRLLFLLVLVTSCCHAQLAGLDALHLKGDLAGEEKLLQTVAGTGTNEDRATAERRLAWLSWRFRKDYDAARAHFERAESLRPAQSETLLARAAMEAAGGHFAEARSLAGRVLEMPVRKPQRTAAVMAFCTATTEEILGRELDGQGGAVAGSELLAIARRALEFIEPEVRGDMGRFAPSRQMLQLALITGDGPRALLAWRSYFWVTEGSTAQGRIAAPGQILAELLPRWGAGALPEDNRKLVNALAGSALYPEAALVAFATGVPAPETLAYVRFCRRAARAAEEFYRLTAIGTPAAKGLKDTVLETAGPLWKEVSWDGPAPSLDWQSLYKELATRFGTEITAPAWGLALGQRILDETRDIEQYGHKARIRFMLLDGMVSRGYIHWLTEGKAGTGGYAGERGTIATIQMRADDAVRVWTEVTDPFTRAKADEVTEQATREDEALARKEPVAYFRGLHSRMWRDACRGVLSSLEAKGLKDDALRVSFLAEFQGLMDGCTNAHEGRHAIELGMGMEVGTGAGLFEPELRARLSQMTLTPRPALCMGSVFVPNIDHPTDAHGRANRRIMEGLIEWMRANQERIAGLDPAKPLLPQFDRLSDEQMRAAYRSMDPLAQKPEGQ